MPGGRPRKHNAEHFPHDNSMRSDKKLKAVRSRFGLAGYAIYNMLLESLAEANLIQLKWCDLEIEIIAGDFGVESEKLKEMVDYFCLINLMQCKNKILRCAQLELRLQPLFEKRKTTLDSLRSENLVSGAETELSIQKPEFPSRSKEEYSKEEKSKEEKSIKKIVSYLNVQTGKSFKSNTEKTKKCIVARINEGFTEEDFFRVINNKCSQWLTDEKMNPYLRPETLFGTKFESYLNEKQNNAPSTQITAQQTKEMLRKQLEG